MNAQTRFDRLKNRDDELEAVRAAFEHQADGGYHRRANTVTLLLPPPAAQGTVPLTSSAPPAFDIAPPEHFASGPGPNAGVCMLTSSPSVAAIMPAPVLPALHAREVGASLALTVARLNAGSRSADILALDSISTEHNSSPNDMSLSSEHQAPVQTGASGPSCAASAARAG